MDSLDFEIYRYSDFEFDPKYELDTGDPVIDEFFRNASLFEQTGSSCVYIALKLAPPLEVIGFFALSADAIRLKLNGQEKKWPAILLGQLGVVKSYQTQGIGTALVEYIKTLVKGLSQQIGIRLIVLHTYKEANLRYFEQQQFTFERIDKVRGKKRYLMVLDILK